MSSKVQPESTFPPTLKKPIPCTPPLTAFDANYVRRKQEIVEKTFTCKSGRTFSYFLDGGDPSQNDVAVVLCLHGAASDKYNWLQPQPFEKICLVSVDRFGHGSSSSTPVDSYSFADGCPEFLELMDAVYAENKIPAEKKFFVVGHSMGGTWTVSMASCPEVCHRIEAVALVCSPCDVRHPQMTAEERKKAGVIGFLTGLKKKGCGGSINRWLFWKLLGQWVICNGDRTSDFGMAGWYKTCVNECGGDERGKGALHANPFFVTLAIDSNRGHNTKDDVYVEWGRCWAEPWSYDPANVKVPCFIYNGEKEIVNRAFADFHHKIIPGSELTIWSGHSEMTILLEFGRIIEALVKKQKVEGGPCFST